MNTFKTALNNVIDAIYAQHDEGDMCMAVYWDDICEDNAMILLMDSSPYISIHAFMQDLHDKLSEELGWPVSICHNSPEDDSILIHGHKDDSCAYDMNTCCKEQTIEMCLEYLKAGEGYRTEIQTLALAVEAYADMCEKPVEEILGYINWHREPLPQLTHLFIDAYNFTKE